MCMTVTGSRRDSMLLYFVAVRWPLVAAVFKTRKITSLTCANIGLNQ
jgi:hypothetical protein